MYINYLGPIKPLQTGDFSFKNFYLLVCTGKIDNFSLPKDPPYSEAAFEQGQVVRVYGRQAQGKLDKCTRKTSESIVF